MKLVRDFHGIVHQLVSDSSHLWDLTHCERFFHYRLIYAGYGMLTPCPSDADPPVTCLACLGAPAWNFQTINITYTVKV